MSDQDNSKAAKGRDPFAKKAPKKIFAERKLLRSGKHGLKWQEGPARAKKTGKPQGQFGSKSDIDFAVQKGREIGPGKTDIFDLPKGHSSFVHIPDGNVVPAKKVFVKVYPSGKVHAYPLP
ncbi:MAG: hypothetical protein ACPGWR_08705 [Ardenticatenaceae bacterium]